MHRVSARLSSLARPFALLLVVVAAAACVGAGAGAAAVDAPRPTPDRDEVVFRVQVTGGFVAPFTRLGELPVVTVYADGRVITRGPQIEIFPGPLMPNLQEKTISPAALDRLVELAREKGLLANASYGHTGIADAATTYLTIVVDGVTYTQEAYALAEGSALEADVPAGDRAGRAAIRSFIDALVNIPAADVVSADTTYDPAAVRLYIAEFDPASVDPSMVQPEIAWPLVSDLGAIGKSVAEGGEYDRCAVIEGEELAALEPALDRATALTPFASAGDAYSLVVRPLLPDESGC